MDTTWVAAMILASGVAVGFETTDEDDAVQENNLPPLAAPAPDVTDVSEPETVAILIMQ